MHIPEVNAFETEYLNKILGDRHYPVDRVLHDELTLPYRFDQIKIKPNDDANALTFNLSMDRLYDNFLYLVSNTKLSPPMDSDYYNRLNTSSRPIYDARAGALWTHWKHAFVDTTKNECVDQIMQKAHETDEWYSVAIAKNSNGSSIRLWTERTGETYQSDSVDHNQSKHFQNPVSLCRDNTDHVYVLDQGKTSSTSDESDGPVLYRFNLSGLLHTDPVSIDEQITTQGRRLHKYVGGIRATHVEDKARFMQPKRVLSDGDHMYVVDVSKSSDNREIAIVKKYDARLNWMQNYPLLNIDTRSDNTVQEDGYEPQFKDMIMYNDKFLVITGDALNIYDSQLAFENTIDMKRDHYEHGGTSTDTPMFIKPSEVNPNILYIIRQQSIEKVYYTRLDTSIRIYPIYKSYTTGNQPVRDWTNINNISVYEKQPDLIHNRGDINIIQHDHMKTIVEHSPGDTIVVGLNRSHQNMYYWIDNEIDIRKELLYDQFEHQLYTMKQVDVDPEEQVSNFVYNKSISKMLYNMQQFVQHLKGVFAIRGGWNQELEDGSYNYHPPRFEGIHYDVNNPTISSDFQPIMDNFVHITEPFVTGVFNRCFYELYKLQLELLDVLQIHWVHESNVFELKDILAPPCPGGIESDAELAMITDGLLCIMPDDDNDKIDICSMYAIDTCNTGSIVDCKGTCIIYGVKQESA